jgi:hypothetical protein
MAVQQRVDADAQHRAHDIGGKRLAHANRVCDDQVVLEFDMQRAAGCARTRQFVAEWMRAEQLVGIAAEALKRVARRALPAPAAHA